MSRIALLGATGSLGSHVAQQALAAGHELSVFVRTPSKIAPEVAAQSRVHTGDLMQTPVEQLAEFVAGQDVLVSCAGLVTEGQRFVDLFDHVVTVAELLAPGRRPTMCWFLAGAGVLDLDSTKRRGVDLPKVRDIYWPHRVNFERLQRSAIEWRLLCPGPMVPEPAVGVEKLRVSVDTLPAALPAWLKHLPRLLVLPFFAARIPEMIIPYADAAAFMLAHIDAGGPLARKRVGLALPPGMKGTKEHWAARPREA
ncbi:MAG: NAD(P)H-binding protein [Ramlibacter sp.]